MDVGFHWFRWLAELLVVSSGAYPHTAGARRARLSGSGSALFGLFPSVDDAEAAREPLGTLPEGTHVRVVATVSRREYAEWSSARVAADGEGR